MPAPAPRGRTMSRLWTSDEELAKKDDDLNAPRHARQGGPGQAARAPRRSSVLRLVAYAAAAFIIVFTLSSLMSPRQSDDVDQKNSKSVAADRLSQYGSSGSPSGGTGKAHLAEVTRTYDGPVRFSALGRTLYSIQKTGGKQPINRNVLFAAASLKSAATLLPLACQMAMDRQNYVHFAFVGRSEIPMKTLFALNGIAHQCQVIPHDARPDKAIYSTDARLGIATARALMHIELYMHPQATLVDSTNDEEEYFLSAVRDQIRSMRSSLIELPDSPGTRLSWLTYLDCASLAAWNKAHVDIVIHAPANGAANLDRLLRSLSQVDMGGMAVPHLTIELPNRVDSHVESLVADYQWPPPTTIEDHRPHMLSLRHRIARKKLTEEESSVRFLESYWPQNPTYSNVLILSAHAEVTPQFLHYVKYSLLHHRYSNAAVVQNWDKKMMGLSFALPSTLLDSTTALNLPVTTDEAGSSFLWQAPSSDAMLIPGSKWVELHDYVSRFLERQELSSDSPMLTSLRAISKKYPSWLEYILQLSRIRGYLTVYPSKETTSVILGVHNDILDVPEEYEGDLEARRDAAGGGPGDEASYVFDAHWQVDILQTLPRGGHLPYMTQVPIVSWDGKEVSVEELDADAEQFAKHFREEVGGCEDGITDKPSDPLAGDLFCLPSGGA